MPSISKMDNCTNIGLTQMEISFGEDTILTTTSPGNTMIRMTIKVERTKKGNNTLVDGPQPVDEKFHGPDQLAYQRENDLNAGHVVAGVAVGVAVYQIAKWAIATILAPSTGGGSYAFAALTP